MSSETRTLGQDLGTLKQSIDLINRLNPWALLTMAGLQFLETIIPLMNVVLPAMLIDELASASRSYDRVISLVHIIIILNALTQISRRVLVQMRVHQRNRFGYLVKFELAKATATMDYQYAEAPTTQVLRERIKEGMNMGGISSLIAYLCYFGNGLLSAGLSLSIIATLLSMPSSEPGISWLALIDSPLAAIALFGLIILALLINLRSTKAINNLHTENMEVMAKNERKYSYLMSTLINDYRFHKDIRLYGMAPMLKLKMTELIESNAGIASRFCRKLMSKQFINQFSSSLVTVAIYFYIAIKAYLGTVPIGGILLYVGAISQFNQGCLTIVTNFSELRWYIGITQDLLDYLNLPQSLATGSVSLAMGTEKAYELEVQNVSFRYPGSDDFVLFNVNMKIRQGERMAIVGMNGSGKTTLIKLLCRFYEPTEGRILLNGIDIKEIKMSDYLDLFAVVFQDFMLFSLPIGQNVASSYEYNAEKVATSLEQAGFKERLDRMTSGLDTALYKHTDRDGVEVSGGEGQKIAIARALYKDAPFVILDEPTAALDPFSEAEIYAYFNDLVHGKAAVYISHRLSSCRFCQNIAVFHEGKLVQLGSHDDLLTECSGKYYELWQAQAQYYA